MIINRIISCIQELYAVYIGLNIYIYSFIIRVILLRKVLIAAPVCQNPIILREYLSSLSELVVEGFEVSYLFMDDNQEEESTKLLGDFVKENGGFILGKGQNKYYKGSHIWDNSLMERVGNLKNQIIDFTIEQNFDYLFLVDSDLCLHPNTLIQLLSDDEDIVFNIFWTKWDKNGLELPQVWLFDQYTLYEKNKGENLTNKEIESRTLDFISKLRVQGLYQVGHGGACTLIKRRVLEAGVNFDDIYNLSFLGEDRYFCIRAAVMGFKMYVDTNYPAFHIYRHKELENLRYWEIENFIAGRSSTIYFPQKDDFSSLSTVVSWVLLNEKEGCLFLISESEAPEIEKLLKENFGDKLLNNHALDIIILDEMPNLIKFKADLIIAHRNSIERTQIEDIANIKGIKLVYL